MAQICQRATETETTTTSTTTTTTTWTRHGLTTIMDTALDTKISFWSFPAFWRWSHSEKPENRGKGQRRHQARRRTKIEENEPGLRIGWNDESELAMRRERDRWKANSPCGASVTDGETSSRRGAHCGAAKKMMKYGAMKNDEMLQNRPVLCFLFLFFLILVY